MKLTPAHIARLEAFLAGIHAQTYPEPPTEIHTKGTNLMFSKVLAFAGLAPGAAVLDVGCGQGTALDLFARAGMRPIGITVNAADLDACRVRGFDVRAMDQSFLDFPDASFDLVWCRHCIEHSVMPFFTLHELTRVLKPGGVLYLEVPAPDTSAEHEKNLNHYSVLGKRAWASLLERLGYNEGSEVHDLDVDFRQGGTDVYWAFIVRKPAGHI